MVKLADVPGMGKASDSEKRSDTRKRTKGLLQSVKMARKEIFKGYAVNGSRIERCLNDGSRVAINVQFQIITSPMVSLITDPAECIYDLSPWAECLCITYS